MSWNNGSNLTFRAFPANRYLLHGAPLLQNASIDTLVAQEPSISMERTHRFLRSLILAGNGLGLCLSNAAGAAPPLEAYGNLPQVEYLRVSPSGERVAMVGVIGDKRQLVLAEVAGSKLIKAAALGENKVRDMSWAGDEHVLVSITATTASLYDFGNQRLELGGVLHVGLDGRAPWSVFEHSDNIEHTVLENYGAYPQQGHWSGYFGGLSLVRQRGFGDNGYTRQHTYIDLYRVDLETSQPTLLASGAGREHEWVLGADGSIVAHVEYAEGSGEWVLYAGAVRDKVLLKKTTPTRDMRIAGLGRSPGTVLVIDRTGDEDIATEIDVATGHSDTILADVGIARYLFDPITGLLVGATTVPDPWAKFFDPAMQNHYNNIRNAFPHQRLRLESFTPNLKEMVVFTDGTADAGTFWFVNRTTSRADPIGYPYPQIKAGDVGPVRSIVYTASDGMGMDGVLTLPPGRDAKNLPLVVLPHGGPIGPWDEPKFDWWPQAFASRGYAVFQPNYRGSGGHSVAFRNAGNGEWGRKILSDITDGVAELTKLALIDPKRACIVGGSYGGYAALAGVTLQQGLYRCAVSVAGPADMATFMSWEAQRFGVNSPALRKMQKITGADTASASYLHDISPRQFAKRADAPILLIHGKDDTRVPIEQSRQMASALKAYSKSVEFVELEKEDHFLSRDVTRTVMLKAALNFVEKYNPPQ
jgi:pimeloyl-ACP methyl ester carboxylesterase